MAVTETLEICSLYAVIEAEAAAGERLSAALAAADIASVLIVPVAGARLEAAAARPLVEIAQRAGAAALIANDASLARALRADGVHLGAAKDVGQAYEEARGVVGRGAIVGADVGISRHDAMALAEAGADYIAFGAPRHLKDRDKARERRNDLVAWWAEIFEVPCVAFDVDTPEEARALSEVGADFVAVTIAAGETPAAARDRVVKAATAIRLPEAAA